MTKLSDAAVYDSNNQCICVIIDENKADTETAAFIVAACNAYEANQKALRVAVEALEWYENEKHWDETGVPGTAFCTPSSPNAPEEWDFEPDNGTVAVNALERIREIQEGK